MQNKQTKHKRGNTEELFKVLEWFCILSSMVVTRIHVCGKIGLCTKKKKRGNFTACKNFINVSKVNTYLHMVKPWLNSFALFILYFPESINKIHYFYNNKYM